MNSDVLAGKWKQLKGDAQKEWGKLTDDELDQIEGDHEALVGKIQEKYGYARAEAEQKVSDWMDKAGK